MAAKTVSAGVKTPSRHSKAKCRNISAKHKEELFNEYVKPRMKDVWTLTKRYTDDYHDIEENYNHCLAQLYNYIGSYNPAQKLDTWLHICVKRACFHQNKKRAEENSHMTDMEMCTQDDLYQHGTSMMVDAGFGTLVDNLSDEVYHALMSIPIVRLSPFLLQIQGMRIREIVESEWQSGHLEKRSEDLVKSRIYWARMELKYILKKHGVSGSNGKG